MTQTDRFLSVGEAAELLGVTPATLRNWDKAGKLVPSRDPSNGYRRYPLKSLMAFVAEPQAAYQSPEMTAVCAKVALDERAFRHLIRQISAAYRDSEGGLLERFEEVTKLLHAKLFDEVQTKLNAAYQTKFFKGNDDPKKTFARIQSLYKESIDPLDPLFANGRGVLQTNEAAVCRAVELLQTISLSSMGSHTTGTAYEELIRNTFEKNENQQFFTPRTVVQFMISMLEIRGGSTLCDPACGSGGFLSEALDQNGSCRLFGLEIDKRMAWVTKMNLALHGAEDSTIVLKQDGGSLGIPEGLMEFVPKDGFDYIVTNPPFGSDFQDKEALGQFELGKGRNSRRRGALFVERCIQWLKRGNGRLAIVLDDSILNGSSNQDVRALILRESHVEAVISLPEVAFKPYASVKTSILVLRRRAKSDKSANSAVFMADVTHVGRKPNGDPLVTRATDGSPQVHNELIKVLALWHSFKQGQTSIESEEPNAYVCSAERFSRALSVENRLDVLFHHPSRAASEEALKRSAYSLRKLGELVDLRNVSAVPSLSDPSEVWRHIGLAQISARTGEYEVSESVGDQLKSAVKKIEPNDVVFSKLRPELRKCFVAAPEADDTYVSAECFVFSPRNGECNLFEERTAIDPHFLAVILRSDLVYGQLVYQITGTGRPRVGLNALLNIRIPVPPIETQREIVAAHRLAEKQYLEHRRRSEDELHRGMEVLKRIESFAEERLCMT